MEKLSEEEASVMELASRFGLSLRKNLAFPLPAYILYDSSRDVIGPTPMGYIKAFLKGIEYGRERKE